MSVENAYGRPRKSEREMKSYGEKVEYEYGNSLDFEFVNGKLTKIKADDFSDAKTKAGIGLGASMDMVKSAYGEPDFIHEEDFIYYAEGMQGPDFIHEEDFIYYAEGMQGIGLKIEIKYGKVTEIKCGVLN